MILSRRRFLFVSATASGALLVGWRSGNAQQELPYLGAHDDASHVGPFVRIEKDGRVIVGARGSEVGQGVKTSLPMLIAEELDVDWTHVQVTQLAYGYAETDAGPADRYGTQRTGNSEAIPAGWKDLREAGAVARWLLIEAAARQWDIPAERLHSGESNIISPDGRKLSYGALAAAAAALDPPKVLIPLKNPDQFKIIGKPTPTVDLHDIVVGRAEFGIDAYLADMLFAVVLRCPHVDGTLSKVDDADTRKVPGVKDVIVIGGPKPDAAVDGPLVAGVAVLAESTWAALKGRDKLKVEWNPGPWATESTSALGSKANQLLEHNQDGVSVRKDGDFALARKQAQSTVEARYELPFLAHATMEPPNALISVEKDKVLLIAGLQNPDGASRVIHDVTGVARDKIDIHLPRAGGSFGRRLKNDYVAEAALIGKAAGKPVKVLWTREDDLQHDFYRPFGVHALSATLDKKKKLTGWSHRCAATPCNYRNSAMQGRPINLGCLESDDFPAGLIANLDKTFFPIKSGILREDSHGAVHTFNAFAVQSFIDEIAVTTKQDAVQLRLELLGEPRKLRSNIVDAPEFDTGRLAVVLKLAAEKIGWTDRRTDGHGLGIACNFAFGGYAAHAFEVSMEGTELRIHRAVCAVDVGRVINPLGVEAQMMIGTNNGISAALNLAITIKDGQVQQHGFQDYPLLRMGQAPQNVEVYIVETTENPSGAGEIGIASAAPALANAIYAATTVRVRKLPLMAELLRML